MKIQLVNKKTNYGTMEEHNITPPNVCPICNHNIAPIYVTAYSTKNNYFCVNFICPACHEDFHVKYDICNSFITQYPCKINTPDFPNAIKELSPNFVQIYSEAFIAEKQKLINIAGPGYRKAVEFLIKDFAIHKKPDDAENITRENLSSCIKNYIENYEIKELSNRAAWLGNDAVHYLKKHTNKDLSDLKIIINLLVKWIDLNLSTENALTISPQK